MGIEASEEVSIVSPPSFLFDILAVLGLLDPCEPVRREQHVHIPSIKCRLARRQRVTCTNMLNSYTRVKISQAITGLK